MNTNLGYKIKLIREQNGLTQSELASLLFVDTNLISGYESGSTPLPFSFISSICKHFNISLCYFDEDKNKESQSKDLIIAQKNGKVAIFDPTQSIFLCSHKYDRIVLSSSNFHVGIIYENEKIVYNDIITNNGEIIKVDSDYSIGYRNGFNEFGIAIAYKNSTDTATFIFPNGKTFDKEYKVINERGSSKGLPFYFECKIDIEKGIEEYYTSSLQPLDFKYSNFDELISRIEKYGCVMLNHMDKDNLVPPENFIKILNAVDKYILTSLTSASKEKQRGIINELFIALDFLENNLQYAAKIIPITFPYYYKANYREYIPNKIERNFAYKKENELLKKLIH